MKNKAFDKSKYVNWIDPNKVKPYERNAKVHTDRQVNNICTSIRRFGWQQDTVITSDNVLVIGHGRRLAAIKLGCEMPYHVIDKKADELTDEDIRELRIADNQTNAETGIDFSVLDLEVGDLSFDGFDYFFAGVKAEENDENEDQYGYTPAGWEPPDDEGFRSEQEPLSEEELKEYESKADNYLVMRRVIITYMPEKEDYIRRMLGITEDKIRVVYSLDELMGADEE